GVPNQGLPGDGAGQEPKVHVTSDDSTNRVFVSGPPNKLEQAKKALEEMDVQQPGQLPVQVGPLEYQTYSAPGGNAEALVKSLKELYGKSSSAVIAAVGKERVMV